MLQAEAVDSDASPCAELDYTRRAENRREKLDREGVMLWNRSSVMRHLLSRDTPSTLESAQESHDKDPNYKLKGGFVAFSRLVVYLSCSFPCS